MGEDSLITDLYEPDFRKRLVKHEILDSPDSRSVSGIPKWLPCHFSVIFSIKSWIKATIYLVTYLQQHSVSQVGMAVSLWADKGIPRPVLTPDTFDMTLPFATEVTVYQLIARYARTQAILTCGKAYFAFPRL